jgi:hypothetical protein
MTSIHPASHYVRVRCVGSFAELVATPWAQGVNALVWERTLAGDFQEVAAQLGSGEGVETLDEARLRALHLGAAGAAAVEVMLADLRLLREQSLDPVLNCIHGYPRDESPGPVATDVFSFHADSAPIEASTYLCTYHGPPSEGLRNEEAWRKVDLPDIRAQLVREYGGADDADFLTYLNEYCYDLHYAPKPGAQPYSFGLGHLWRIAVEHPGCAVPPCIHRAPETPPGVSRLLLIS